MDYLSLCLFNNIIDYNDNMKKDIQQKLEKEIYSVRNNQKKLTTVGNIISHT